MPKLVNIFKIILFSLAVSCSASTQFYVHGPIAGQHLFTTPLIKSISRVSNPDLKRIDVYVIPYLNRDGQNGIFFKLVSSGATNAYGYGHYYITADAKLLFYLIDMGTGLDESLMIYDGVPKKYLNLWLSEKEEF